MSTYGEALKYQREINNYSQCQLAKLTGISQENISRWEAGTVYPNIDFCVKLADFYQISLDELVGRDHGRINK
ncbi:MAG: helix-turn-helix transcriptional regulator [Clostridia bacterium]|nr:helix-turn-helix transcriptional regulator [Clostridia bacterium]